MGSLKSQRFLRVILLAAIAWLGLRLGLNWTLGVVLQRVFTSGTGCEVRLSSPRLELFPLRGRVSQVLIKHPSEPADAGFSAARLEISLAFLPLFQREVRLHRLKIEGAKAASIGDDTGFIKTLAFLFPPSEEAKPASPPAGFFSGFVFHVTDIEIDSLGNEAPQLILGDRETELHLTGIGLSFIEQDADAAKPFDVVASADTAELRYGSVSGGKTGRVEISGALGLGKLALSKAELRGSSDPESILRVSGAMGLRKTSSYDFFAEGSFRENSLRDLLPGSPVGYPDAVGLRSNVRGLLPAPEIDGEVSVSSGAHFLPALAEPCRPQQFSTSFSVSRESIRLDKIRVPGTLEGGSFEYSPSQKTIRGKIPFAFSETTLVKDCAALIKRGDGTLQQTLRAARGVIDFQGKTEPRDITARFSAGVPSPLGSHLQGELKLETERIGLNITESARPDNGAPRLSAALSYKPAAREISVSKFRADDLPLSDFVQYALPFLEKEQADRLYRIVTPKTRLDAQAQFDASLRTGAVSGSGLIVLRLPHLLNADVPEIALPFEATKEAISLSMKKAAIGEGTAEGGISYRFSERTLQGVFEAEKIDLRHFLASGGSIPGAARLVRARVELQGNPRDPKLTMHAEFGALDDSAFLLDGSGSFKKLKMKIKQRNGELEADLELDLAESGRPHLQLNGQMRSLKFEPILSGVTPVTGGGVSGNFHYNAFLDRPLVGKGAVELSEFTLQTKTVQITQDSPVRLDLRDGKLDFTHVVLTVGDRPFTISGSLGAEKGWMLDLDGRWNLAVLPHSEDSIQQLSGDLNLSLQVRGPVQQPQFFGTVGVAKAAFAIPVGQDLLDLRDGTLDGTFADDAFTIQAFRMQTSRGLITGSGSIQNIFDESRRSVTMQTTMKRISVEPAENLRIILSGQLHYLRQPGSQPEIVGNIHLDRGSYEQTIDLLKILQQLGNLISGAQRLRSVSRDPGLKGPSAAGLNLRVVAENDLIVETNIVKAELGLNFHVTGTAVSPLIDGQINLIEGEFGAESNAFVINSGNALFSAAKGSLDPELSLVAETTVISGDGQEQQVRMFLSGTITRPKVEFVAESGLSQEEIIALLGLRTNIQSIRLIGKEKENRSLADLINPGSGATLGDRISGITGFSEVQVDTAISGATGEVVPRLVAKRPLVGRLSLDAMSELGGVGLSILNLSYPLNLFVNVISGFRSIPPSGSQVDGSGSLYFGLRHRSTFSGTSLYPHHLTQTNAPDRNTADESFGLPRK